MVMPDSTTLSCHLSNPLGRKGHLGVLLLVFLDREVARTHNGRTSFVLHVVLFPRNPQQSLAIPLRETGVAGSDLMSLLRREAIARERVREG